MLESIWVLSVVLLFVGLIGGFLSGLLGIGGGIIYVFTLTYVYKELFNVGEELGHFVIANSLFVIFLSTAKSTYLFKKNNKFYPKEILLIGIPSTVVSLLFTAYVVNSSLFTELVFDLITTALLIYILISSFLRVRKYKDISTTRLITNRVFYVAGALAGMLSAVTGLGGGTILTPILNGRFKLSMNLVRPISLGVIMVSSFAVTLYNISILPLSSHGSYTIGFINFPLAVMLGIGAMISCKFGVKVGNRLPSKTILIFFIIFVLFLIIRKVYELTY